MAQIVINEISQNYTYNIGTNSYATVALPVTSSWGPGFFDSRRELDEVTEASIKAKDRDQLDKLKWVHYPATQAGLEAFVAAYRGPATNYRLAKDYSYQMAMTLLTAGYDVLVCRLCPGKNATGTFVSGGDSSNLKIDVTAKYPGSFGNNLKVMLKKLPWSGAPSTATYGYYWSLITYVEDPNSRYQTAVENLRFTFNIEDSTDTILHFDELESNFLILSSTIDSEIGDGYDFKFLDTTTGSATNNYGKLSGGSDREDATTNFKEDVKTSYTNRHKRAYADEDPITAPNTHNKEYADSIKDAVKDTDATNLSDIQKQNLMYKEWIYDKLMSVYDLLTDKISYSPQRIICPWDDQDLTLFGDSSKDRMFKNVPDVSPIRKELLYLGYYSRCATALIDIPKCCSKNFVYSTNGEEGYVQKLAKEQYIQDGNVFDVNSFLYSTHSALFAPWGTYTYVGTSKKNSAPPSFLHLMIHRAQVLNQAEQYEWILPVNKKHNLDIGKLDYIVPKHLLDEWQKTEGVGVNVITYIPDLGVNMWGNSTLFDVPPATYQALANLSTRYLVNAVENVAYKCGIGITFQYNNDQAYSAFYAGVTPILDTMKNVGAITGYYVRMSSDLDGLDQVSYNSVLGKIYLKVRGVINDITVDLVALPPDADLDQYRA